MKNAGTDLTDAMRPVRIVHLALKINGHSVAEGNHAYIPARTLTVLGYEWQIDYHPNGHHPNCYHPDDHHPNCYHHGWVKLRLSLVSRATDVTASFTCRLVDPSQRCKPNQEVTESSKFRHGSSKEVPIIHRITLHASGYLDDDGNCFVQCAVAVLFNKPCNEDPDDVAPNALVPSFDLHRHFGDLLKSQKGSDVTFVVAGESFPAHKCVLAARSPVFRAEFFGSMAEKTSQSVEIKEMDPAVFNAMLQFIYTDTLPELEQIHQQEGEEEAMTMAWHMFHAADRYGLERLKMVCVDKLMHAGINVNTVTATLALADQHSSLELKARCIDFIAGATPANLDAIFASEGYKSLVESSPSVLTDVIKAAVIARFKAEKRALRF